MGPRQYGASCSVLYFMYRLLLRLSDLRWQGMYQLIACLRCEHAHSLNSRLDTHAMPAVGTHTSQVYSLAHTSLTLKSIITPLCC